MVNVRETIILSRAFLVFWNWATLPQLLCSGSLVSCSGWRLARELRWGFGPVRMELASIPVAGRLDPQQDAQKTGRYS